MLGKIKPFPIVIVAPSGAGKTTICQTLLNKLPTVKRSISATTRKPREGEIDGKDYYFLSRPVFNEWVEEGKFFEWAEVYGELYGTPKEPFNQYLIEGYNVLLAVDIQGVRAIKMNYPEAISIFILPPSIEELKNRLFKRDKESEKRLKLAELELSYLNESDYIVVNDKINTTVAKIIAIITAEECRSWRYER